MEAGSSLRATFGRLAFHHPNRWPVTWHWTGLLAASLVIFSGLRIVAANQPQPVDLPYDSRKVVVVGTTGHYALTAQDQTILQEQSAVAQLGAVSVRPRDIGECAAAGWATLGTGRRTTVGGLCEPQVVNGEVADWPERLAAAATRWGDAKLGTLAASVPGCVMAVGPGASLAAAHPDGSVDRFQTLQQFLAGGAATPCPLTLIDSDENADEVLTALPRGSSMTVIVTGIGPPPGSNKAGLQVIYRIGSGPAGWLTSASTHRGGIVTLPDLTRTLIESVGQSPGEIAALLDGAPFQVLPHHVSGHDEQDHLRAVASLSDAARVTDIAVGVVGAVLAVVLLHGLLRHRLGAPRLILALGTVLPAAMMLTGVAAWNRTSSPVLALSGMVACWSLLLTAAALGLATAARVPVALVGATLSVAAFTIDAALGGVMQPGSMLSSRPVDGGRWYGFGNVTFAAYAAAGLLLAGLVAHRLRVAGRPRAGLVAAAAIGFGVVLCDGWPSMGADVGGVLALTPGVLALLLALSRIALTWRTLGLVSAATTVLVAGLLALDWRRGPTARTHLGAFFQRVLDGDAGSIILRKATAAAASLASPLGMVGVIGGMTLWILVFKVIAEISGDTATLRPVGTAALITAILGTLLNDTGATIWLTLTAAFALSIGSIWIDSQQDRSTFADGKEPEHETPYRRRLSSGSRAQRLQQ